MHSEVFLLMVVLGMSVIGLGFAYRLAGWVLQHGTGSEKMREISNAIKEGAEAFLSRQFRTIVALALVLAAVLFVGYGLVREHRDFDPVGSRTVLAFWVTFSFVLGAACSLVAGYMGMWVSILANIRTAAGFANGVNEALQVALRAGAVSGLMVVAMSLLGVGGLYALVKLP